VVRAWKDAAYRAELTSDQLAVLPQNPVGELELDLTDAELALIGGGVEGDVQSESFLIVGDPDTDTKMPGYCTCAPCTFTLIRKKCEEGYTKYYPSCAADEEVIGVL
jgi:mersacidin/lichenicidin family type 2 lantibiotic